MPIQVLENNKRGILSALLGGATRGASAAADLYPEMMKQQQLQEDKKNKLIGQKHVDAYLKKRGFDDAINLPDDYKKALFLDDLRQQNKKTTAKKPIAYSDIKNVFLSTGYNDRDIEDVRHEGMDAIRDLATQYEEEGLDRQAAISKAIKKQRNPSELSSDALYNAPEEEINIKEGLANASPEEQEGIFAAGEKGIQSSVAGRLTAILNGVPYDEYQKQTELKNPGIMNKFAKEFGRFIIGNAPFVAAGGTLGAEVGGAAGSLVGPFGAVAGGLIGGGGGALALPAALDTALEEYHKYKSNGGEKPFDAFIEGLAKTAESGIESGIQGATLGILGQSLPMLKQIPQLASLFEAPYLGKAAQKTAVGAVQATGILGSESLSKGKLPTSEEVVDTFTQILGFNMLGGLPEKAKESVMNRIKKSGMPPDQVATQLKERLGDKTADAKTIVREIVDITKSHQGPEKQAAESIIKTLGEVKAPEPKETAKKLASRDIPEALDYERRVEESKNKPPTEKELAKRANAKEMAEELLGEKKFVEDDIKYLEEQSSKGPKYNKELAQVALKAKEKELQQLLIREMNLRAVAEKGVEPFSEEAFKEPIEKHMDELDKAAADPEGTTAQEWKAMFARDQKHVNDFAKILEKGELPPPKSKDRYIKTLEVYQKAYDSMIDQMHKGIKERQETYDSLNKRTKQAKALKNEIDHLQRKLDILAQNSKINESKIGKQKDKLSTLYELNKPGSAMTKQILKGMRKDIVDLQKEFIKHKTELDKFEKKTEKTAKGKLKESAKLLKEYQETGNKNILDKIAEENNVPVEEMRKFEEQTKADAKGIADHIAKGKPQDKAESLYDKSIKKVKNFGFNLPKNITYTLLGIWIQEAIEEIIGYKPPFNIIAGSLPGSTPERYIRSTIASAYKHFRKKYDISKLKNKYATLKTLDERSSFRNKLRGDYTKAQIDEITH